MDKIHCSVGILTFNSGATLRRALESVKEFDDIIVCDGGSTDATLDIAREYGAKIIVQDAAFKNVDGSLKDYSGVRNQCLDVAKHDWFLYIDSDEEAMPALVKEIREITGSTDPSHLVYNISPRIVLDGRLIEYSSNYPGWQKRFFNRTTGARFRKAIHERITYDEGRYRAGYLAGHWCYFIFSDNDGGKRTHYARMEAVRYRPQTLGALSIFIVRKAATITKTTIRALINNLIHPRTSLPLALEWRRIRYQAEILWFTLRAAQNT